MRGAATRSTHRQRGFSLLEVMVAGIIMSSGLAGVAALMLTAVVGTSDVADRTTASFLADSLASLVEISPSQAAVFLQSAPADILACNQTRPCSAAEFAGSNYRSWQQEVIRHFPGGTGTVCFDATPDDGTAADHQCDGNGSLHIKIFWRQRTGSDGLDSRVARALPS